MSLVPEPILKSVERQKRKPEGEAGAELAAAPAVAAADGDDSGGASKRTRREEGGDDVADATMTETAAAAPAPAPVTFKHRFAVVCRSNMNRSMANHDILLRNGFSVCSYGIGKEVKVPSRDKKGRMFPFGTPYKDILTFLTKEDEQFNTDSRVIPMLKRNKEIKLAPEDFRKIPDEDLRKIDVVICSEYDIFERVVEDIEGRDAEEFKPIHVLNLETTDNNEDAIEKAEALLQLCKLCAATEDIENEFTEVLENFKAEYASDDELLYSQQHL